MAWRARWEKVKEPVSGFAGAGAGLFAGELTSEFTARVTGRTGYEKAGVKTAVKFGLGLLTFATGVAMGGAWSIFWKVFGFSNWGSIVLDWLYAAYPGGVFGLAERMAVTVRTWAMGAKAVAAELEAIEKATITKAYTKTPTPTPTPGGYQVTA